LDLAFEFRRISFRSTSRIVHADVCTGAGAAVQIDRHVAVSFCASTEASTYQPGAGARLYSSLLLSFQLLTKEEEEEGQSLLMSLMSLMSNMPLLTVLALFLAWRSYVGLKNPISIEARPGRGDSI
jgi:hypothetical protein